MEGWSAPSLRHRTRPDLRDGPRNGDLSASKDPTRGRASPMVCRATYGGRGVPAIYPLSRGPQLSPHLHLVIEALRIAGVPE